MDFVEESRSFKEVPSQIGFWKELTDWLHWTLRVALIFRRFTCHTGNQTSKKKRLTNFTSVTYGCKRSSNNKWLAQQNVTATNKHNAKTKPQQQNRIFNKNK